MNKSRQKIRILTHGALACALTLALAQVRFFRMPWGGSVTADMVPIVFFSIIWGPWWGMMVGAVAGGAQFMIKPEGFHPIQILMDYPLAYSVLGIAGFMRVKPMLAVISAASIRLVVHSIAGVVFFAAYAPEDWVVWHYSVAYNAAYLIPSAIITLIAVKAILLRYRALEKASPAEQYR